ncbi:uncharacterized protein LOC129945983 [Eupeodes corollae]|uniref:uncharacterized protein LOC129945983 n=1 Tax=Eupeodes corollae TaxID=290404 RepID=UPI0024911CA4|nr:uncharacterized protein LOC129945983 [Eupeodes corollae]
MTILTFIEFLERRCDALESCQTLNRLSSSSSRGKPASSIRALIANPSENSSQCPLCKTNHLLHQCSKFLELDIPSRRNFTKTNVLCFNCLRSGHSVKKCRSTFRCRVCKARHHYLVHQDESNNISAPVSDPSQTNQSTSSSSSASLQNQSSGTPNPYAITHLVSNHSREFSLRKQTVLPTILAKLENNKNQLIDVRVLLDTGSQSSFISESCVQKLGLRRTHARIPVLGLGSMEAGFTKGVVSLKLLSRYSSTFLTVDALVLTKLTSNLPSNSFDISTLDYICNLDLADPGFNFSCAVDVILGADKVWSILKSDQVVGPPGKPIAQNTSFGWVITGEFFDPTSGNFELSSYHSALDLDALLQRFWELEHISSYNSFDAFNDPAEKHFQQTFSRASDGKYVVALPFKTPLPNFEGTLHSAVSRLYSMERRFQKHPELKRQYSEFMQEYLDLGHMELIPQSDIQKNPCSQFYLPHHAVFKPDSSTTKLRVVFDGSVKDSNGQSLNSKLLIGPPIQRDLIGVCLRFRQHRYVFTADIVKMFRQIWVNEKDCDYQRIVWRSNPNNHIEHYRLRTVTYGTASAPFLSVRVLQQIAEDYKTVYPNASRVLLSDVYVDDVMTGGNSIQTLLDLQSELTSLLSEARLQLRKWSSNCWALLAKQNPEDCEYSFVDPERSQSLIKVLGMYWNPASDMYSYRLTTSKPCPLITRRTLLSEVASIFDPLGLLAPSVILFKMLFQNLWSLTLGWDDPLPTDLAEKWITYREQLPCFEKICVPRNVFSSEQTIELHGFSDASSLAYAAVVYALSKSADGKVNVVIVAAKTKVAPLKPVSIPRLELCGAVLLARLIRFVKSSFNINIPRTFAWCDSEIVLHWLSSPPRRWATFVANRTAAILETLPRSAWRHVPSESNPADCASRGVPPSNLFSHNLWWTGPSWLSDSEVSWPKSNLYPSTFNAESAKLEEKSVIRHALVTSFDGHVFHDLIGRISSWSRLQRVAAYIFRYISNLQPKTNPRAVHGLSYPEIQRARIAILKFVQLLFFEDDILHLQTKNQLPAKSKLLRYNAFLDSDGLLRIGGRIKNASVSFNIKHPIILPKSNPISNLIITDFHRRYLHAGVSETFAFIRQQFWIMGSRNLIRKIVHKCKTCFMQRKGNMQQIMGNLPSYRTQPSRPFTNTGCDYAGPITIRLSRCRKAKMSKAYIAVFVCMSTKAIHLELVSDLTTDAFIAALRRFVSRRGKCSNIYSDNGTNFHGARRCLNEMHTLVISQSHNDAVTAALAMDSISWHFIPPSAPHFGGLWEAGVKSVKLHLRRVIGSSILTFEELYTFLTQVEAILNSRPLCSVSDFDLNPLTPGHFLIGEPLTAVPEPSNIDTPINRLSNWNHIQSMVQGFWKRWHTEYLTSLQERPKWTKPTINLRPGDLVVIKEPNLPPTKWILGRIVSVKPGTDERVRVANVRTATGTYVRPISKLALLPMS